MEMYFIFIIISSYHAIMLVHNSISIQMQPDAQKLQVTLFFSANTFPQQTISLKKEAPISYQFTNAIAY